MAFKEFLQSSFQRQYDFMMRAIDGLTPEEFAWRPGLESNSIAFLVWHYGRAMDLWIQNQAQSVPQFWETEWAEKFGQEPDPTNLGFGYTAEQLAAFQVADLDILRAYAETAHASAQTFLAGLDDSAIAETTVTHRSGDPMPLSQLFELLLCEVNQHGGQMAYLRGMQRGLNQ